jgi:hypothetical protein
MNRAARLNAAVRVAGLLADGHVRPDPANSVEKLCFEDTTCASDPLERSQFLAHGGVLPTRHLSPTSRYSDRSGMPELILSMHKRSKSFPCPGEIEFFNRIGQKRS